MTSVSCEPAVTMSVRHSDQLSEGSHVCSFTIKADQRVNIIIIIRNSMFVSRFWRRDVPVARTHLPLRMPSSSGRCCVSTGLTNRIFWSQSPTSSNIWGHGQQPSHDRATPQKDRVFVGCPQVPQEDDEGGWDHRLEDLRKHQEHA